MNLLGNWSHNLYFQFAQGVWKSINKFGKLSAGLNRLTIAGIFLHILRNAEQSRCKPTNFFVHRTLTKQSHINNKKKTNILIETHLNAVPVGKISSMEMRKFGKNRSGPNNNRFNLTLFHLNELWHKSNEKQLEHRRLWNRLHQLYSTKISFLVLTMAWVHSLVDFLRRQYKILIRTCRMNVFNTKESLRCLDAFEKTIKKYTQTYAYTQLWRGRTKKTCWILVIFIENVGFGSFSPFQSISDFIQFQMFISWHTQFTFEIELVN